MPQNSPILMVYNLKILNTFTELGNYHHNLRQLLIYFFSFMDLEFLDILYKSSNTTCGLSVWLSSNLMFLSLIHWQHILILDSFSLPNNIPVYGYITFCSSIHRIAWTHAFTIWGKYLGVELYAKLMLNEHLTF